MIAAACLVVGWKARGRSAPARALRARLSANGARAGRSGTAGLEFALIAPVVVAIILGVVDMARATTIWAQTSSAALAVALAAQSLSLTSDPTQTTLTATQMQNAMTTIYAVIPGLIPGNGSSTGAYSVTVSGVVFTPTCAASSGCAAQTPYTLWTSSLSKGGSQLITSSVERSCGKLTLVAKLSNSSARLAQMVSPAALSGGTTITQAPQIVADVQYVYTPIFSLFLGTMTFWATAVLPAPIGNVGQTVSFSATAPTGNVVSCTVPSS